MSRTASWVSWAVTVLVLRSKPREGFWHGTGHRPHQALQQEPPQRQPSHAVDITARIERRQVLGGLISE